MSLPNHKSCEKRVKTSTEQRNRNRGRRSILRTSIRELRAMTSKEDATPKLKEVSVLLDQAADSNLIHKNNADRNKSRLTRFVASLS
ncbi:MAG: 30S ribosomal protein S20 [candidate division Zixibacteria bacterium]|nr:30S ribosomal protein S20 [candidate division Zixibacteria bacterium]